MKLLLLLTTAAAVCSGVVLDKAVSGSFSGSASVNALPAPPQDQSLSSQYGPPPPPPPSSGGPNLQYGPPPQFPPSFSYGPPPPPPPFPKKNKFEVYKNALSLFDGECAPWKGLSTILLLLGAATGLGLLLRAWPLHLNILGADGADILKSRLSDPDFLSSVYEQVSDISRVLSNIQEANYDDDKE